MDSVQHLNPVVQSHGSETSNAPVRGVFIAPPPRSTRRVEPTATHATDSDVPVRPGPVFFVTTTTQPVPRRNFSWFGCGFEHHEYAPNHPTVHPVQSIFQPVVLETYPDQGDPYPSRLPPVSLPLTPSQSQVFTSCTEVDPVPHPPSGHGSADSIRSAAPPRPELKREVHHWCLCDTCRDLKHEDIFGPEVSQGIYSVGFADLAFSPDTRKALFEEPNEDDIPPIFISDAEIPAEYKQVSTTRESL